MRNFKMGKPCNECPFNKTGKGRVIRLSLVRKRWLGILRNLRNGGVFWCHKTANDVGNGTYKICGGAQRYQAAKGIECMYESLLAILNLSEKRRRRIAHAASGEED